MSPRRRHIPFLCAGLLLAGALLLASCRQDETRTLAEELDQAIADKPLYDARKEARIDELRRLRAIPGFTPRQEYEINTRLYREFKKYQLDSAIRYVERNVELGRQLDSTRCIVESQLRLARLYSSSGMSIEARALLESIDRATLSGPLLHAYYRAYSQFYQHYAALTDQPGYDNISAAYLDSMLGARQTGSLRYRLASTSRLAGQMPPDSAEVLLLRLFEEIAPDDTHHAEVAYMLGSFYRSQGDEQNALKYFMISALTDVRLSVKENASFQLLASLYYGKGDLARAFKYSQAAIEDAIFSKVQFRTAQMAELYSIINAAYQAKEARAKSKLQHYMLLISLLSAVLAVLFVYLYQQLHKLSRTQVELSRANASLRQLNDELGDKNRELSESNDLKEQYIARFFDLCSLYIDKMDGYRKSLYRLAQNRQFDELHKRLKSTSMMENEVDELYKNFDAVFLNLYPTFVADFNALLADEERIRLRPGELLNKELRIYALLRLGITDSSKIAAFLRCSLSTVYNYRTRMRNRASVSKEEFEKKISEIGNSLEKDT